MTYSFNRKRGVQGCMASITLLLAAGFVAFGLLAPFQPWSYAFALWGFFVGYLGVTLALDILSPNPILRIDEEGIYFLPFSLAVVPWRDVTAVTMAQGHSYSRGGPLRPDGKFGFKYSIRDPSAYPRRGGISGIDRGLAMGMLNNTVPLNTLTLIDAQWSDLMAAFREHYPGTITEIPVPGLPSANP